MTAARAASASAAGVGDASVRRAALVVAAVALLAFVPALHGGFVYDDHRFHDGNPHLSSPSILWRAFTDPACQTADGTHAGLWRPLRTLSFALDRFLFGASATGPHAVNVLVHAAGAGILTALLAAWRAPAMAAALGGLVYALHPAQAECVAWISSRGDLLAAACLWGSLLADLRGRGRVAMLLGCAALLAKGEQAVVWPALLVLSRLAAGREFAESVRGAWKPVAAAAGFVIVRAVLLESATQEGGLGHGAATIPVLGSVLAHQAWTAVLPVRPVFDWQMPWVTSPPVAVALVVLGLVAALLVRGARLPAAWFLAALAPTWLVQAVVPLNILVADRFLLFALPALALVVARAAAASRAHAAAAAVAAAALGTMTFTALPVWASDEALWARTAAYEPRHWRANLWLGIEDLRADRLEDAETRLRRAADAAPADAKTLYFLALCLERSGAKARDDAKSQSALLHYRAAIEAFGGPRAEDRGGLLPLARWAEADMTLLTGDLDGARTRIEALLAEPAPVLGEPNRRALEARLSMLARRAEIGLDADLAARVRARGARP